MKLQIWLMLGISVSVDGATLRTVCGSGCQYALNQIQQAVDDAACGDIIQVQAGQNATTNDGLILRNKGCPSGVYTLIRSSALDQLTPNQRIRPATDVNKLAKLTSTSGRVLSVDKGAGYYRLEGMDLTINAGQDPFSMIALFTLLGGSVGDSEISQLSHHLEFDRCWIHGTVQSHGVFGRCMAANTGELSMTNSVVSDCFNQASEAQGIAAWNTTGPFYFRNNQFSASQIGTLFGGSTPTIPGIRATGLYFLGNYYYRPWVWRGTNGTGDPSGPCLFDANGGESYTNTATSHCWRCSSGSWSDQGAVSCPVTSPDKNQFELKNAWGAFAEGNVLQNSWQPAMGQKGAAILFNQVDVFEPADIVAFATLQNNLGLNTPWVLSVGLSGTPFDYPMHDIALDNNLFTNVGGEPQSQGDAVGFQTNATGRFRLSHNTVLFGRDNQTNGGVSVRVDSNTNYMEFFGNILQYGGVAVGGGSGGFINTFSGAGGLASAVQTAWSTGSTMAKNVVINNKGCMTSTNSNAIPCPVQNILTADGGGRIACPSCAVPRFNDNGGSNDVGFVNFSSGDFRLAPTSPFKNWAELGRDAGADIEKINFATAGVVTGAWNSYLDFRISSITTSQTGAQILVKAPTTEPCTTTVAGNWLYADAVFTETDLGGDLNRAIAVSGLSANRRYWVKVICGNSQYRRDDIFYTEPSGSENLQLLVTPLSADVRGGQQVQLTATVYGTLNQTVTWTLQPSVGSINSSGLYSAPASISAPQTVNAVATASDGITKATAVLTLLPPASGTATFVKVDTLTRGNWKGVYGADGANVIGDGVQYPSYVNSISPIGKEDFTFAASTSDIRGLQKLSSLSDRISVAWYAGTFIIDIRFNDQAQHSLAFYCVDWDTNDRIQTMQILDGTFNNVLDTRTLANFHNGAYVVWNVSGRVKLRLNTLAGFNALIEGLFLGPPL